MASFPASRVTIHRLYEVQCETCNEMIDELLHTRREAEDSRRIHIEQHRTDPPLTDAALPTDYREF